MRSFRVQIYPEDMGAYDCELPNSIEILDWQRILNALPQDYEAKCFIGDQSFSTSPASIVTVFVDMYTESRLADDKQDHVVTLSGYTALSIEFLADSARIFEPAIDGSWSFVGEVSIADVQQQFAMSARKLWKQISTVLNES